MRLIGVILVIRFMTKREFFDILLDNESVWHWKHLPFEKLHYLQIVFFKPLFAQIAAVLFFLWGVVPIGFIPIWWLRLVLLALVLYFDYRVRAFLVPAFKGDDCLYEIFRDGGVL